MNVPALRVDLEMLAHVADRGDVRVPNSTWAGWPGSGLHVEGFALFPGGNFDPNELAYRAILRNGSVSPWVTAGEYCGTRGQCLPILGFSVRLRGALAERFDCASSGTFLDGTALDPSPDPAYCIAASFAPLEAMRIVLRPKPPAALLAPVPIRPVRELTSGHITVFPEQNVQYANVLAYSNARETCKQTFIDFLLGTTAGINTVTPEVFIGRYEPGATIAAGDSFLVITADGLVAEQVLPVPHEAPEIRLAYARATAHETVEIAEECLLTTRYGIGTWGHWLNEIFPKAVVAEAVFPGRFRYVVPDALSRPGPDRNFATSLLETFAAYGIAEERLLRIDASKHHRFANLFDVGGFGRASFLHRGVCALMRHGLKEIPPEPSCKMLALERNNTGRRIANLDELRSLLAGRGFEFVDLSRLPFPRQVACFKAAETVFGVYGSGLAGLPYAQKGIGLLACAPANWRDNYYVPVIQERGGRYADVRGPRCEDGVDFKFNAPFHVDPEHLLLGLEALRTP